ncbi:MAG: PmoA family protein [Planctomycetota bacterium]
MLSFRFVAGLLTGLLAVFIAGAAESAETVQIAEGAEKDTLVITVDGQPYLTFQYSAALPKPFFLPVTTAGQVVVNRALGDKSDADHPHHKGIWNAIDEVNGVKFWAEKGVIRTTQVKITAASGKTASFQATNEWRNAETGKAELIEDVQITVYPSRLLVYDMTFRAAHGPVVFEDTKEGLFGFRVAPSMKEKNGGRVTASDGSTTTMKCWGRSFPWVDYSGEVNGKTAGVTIMDHPGNFRPSRYHVRDYGLFSVSPFGEKAYTSGASAAAPVHLEQGKSLRLRYGLYVHDGDAASAGIPAVFDVFAGAGN